MLSSELLEGQRVLKSRSEGADPAKDIWGVVLHSCLPRKPCRVQDEWWNLIPCRLDTMSSTEGVPLHSLITDLKMESPLQRVDMIARLRHERPFSWLCLERDDLERDAKDHRHFLHEQILILRPT